LGGEPLWAKGFKRAGEMSSSLLDIKGIPPEWSQSHVRGLVENIAAVSSVTMQPGPRGGQIAQVRLESTEAAPTCVRQLNGQSAPGHPEWRLDVKVGQGSLPQAPQAGGGKGDEGKGGPKGGKGESMGKGPNANVSQAGYQEPGPWFGKGGQDWACGNFGGKGKDGKGKKGKKDQQNPLFDRGPRGCAINLPKALHSIDCIAGQAGYTGVDFTERDPTQVISIQKPAPPPAAYNEWQWGQQQWGKGAQGGDAWAGGAGKGRGGATAPPAPKGHWINTPCPFCSANVQVEYVPGSGDQYECAHCGGLFALE